MIAWDRDGTPPAVPDLPLATKCKALGLLVLGGLVLVGCVEGFMGWYQVHGVNLDSEEVAARSYSVALVYAASLPAVMLVGGTLLALLVALVAPWLDPLPEARRWQASRRLPGWFQRNQERIRGHLGEGEEPLALLEVDRLETCPGFALTLVWMQLAGVLGISLWIVGLFPEATVGDCLAGPRLALAMVAWVVLGPWVGYLVTPRDLVASAGVVVAVPVLAVGAVRCSPGLPEFLLGPGLPLSLGLAAVHGLLSWRALRQARWPRHLLLTDRGLRLLDRRAGLIWRRQPRGLRVEAGIPGVRVWLEGEEEEVPPLLLMPEELERLVEVSRTRGRPLELVGSESEASLAAELVRLAPGLTLLAAIPMAFAAHYALPTVVLAGPGGFWILDSHRYSVDPQGVVKRSHEWQQRNFPELGAVIWRRVADHFRAADFVAAREAAQSFQRRLRDTPYAIPVEAMRSLSWLPDLLEDLELFAPDPEPPRRGWEPEQDEARARFRLGMAYAVSLQIPEQEALALARHHLAAAARLAPDAPAPALMLAWYTAAKLDRVVDPEQDIELGVEPGPRALAMTRTWLRLAAPLEEVQRHPVWGPAAEALRSWLPAPLEKALRASARGAPTKEGRTTAEAPERAEALDLLERHLPLAGMRALGVRLPGSSTRRAQPALEDPAPRALARDPPADLAALRTSWKLLEE